MPLTSVPSTPSDEALADLKDVYYELLRTVRVLAGPMEDLLSCPGTAPEALKAAMDVADAPLRAVFQSVVRLPMCMCALTAATDSATPAHPAALTGGPLDVIPFPAQSRDELCRLSDALSSSEHPLSARLDLWTFVYQTVPAARGYDATINFTDPLAPMLELGNKSHIPVAGEDGAVAVQHVPADVKYRFVELFEALKGAPRVTDRIEAEWFIRANFDKAFHSDVAKAGKLRIRSVITPDFCGLVAVAIDDNDDKRSGMLSSLRELRNCLGLS